MDTITVIYTSVIADAISTRCHGMVRFLCSSYMALHVGLVSGLAQVDRNIRVAKQVWGDPVAEEQSAEGSGTVRFKTDEITVILQFQNHMGKDVTYHFEPNDFAMVNRLLALNARNQRWDPQFAKETDENKPPTTWLRSDGRFLAEFKQDKLSIRALHVESETKMQPAFNFSPTAVHSDTPKPPTSLQALAKQGDSMNSVLRIHGPPTGKIKRDAIDVWLYPWGTVRLRAEQVIDVSPR